MRKTLHRGTLRAALAVALLPISSVYAIPVIDEDFQDELGGGWRDNFGNAPVNVGRPGQWVPSGHVAHLNPFFANLDNDWSPLVQNQVGAGMIVPTGEYMATLNRVGNQTGTAGVFNMDGIIRFTLADGTPRPALSGETIRGSFNYYVQDGNFGFGFTNSIANLQAYQATMPVWDGGNSSPLMMPTAYADTQSGLSGVRQWGISPDITGHIALNGGYNNLFAHAVVDIAENGGTGDGFVDNGANAPKTDPNSTANRPLTHTAGMLQTIRFEYTIGNSVYDLLQVDQDGPNGPNGFVNILQATSVLTPDPGGPMPVGKVQSQIEGMFITGANLQLTELWYDNIFVEIVVPFVSATWAVDSNGDWSDGGNWTGGTAPNGVGHTANFGTITTAGRIVTVDSPQTVGAINFNSINSYTIGGTSTLTLDADSGAAQVTVLAGGHTISAPVVLNDNLVVNSAGSGVAFTGALSASGKTITKTGLGTVQFENVRAAGLAVDAGTARISAKGAPASASGTSVVNSLSISAGASLDLTNNAAVVDYSTLGTLLSDTRLHAQSGRLTSSLITPSVTAIGYADNAALGVSTFGGQAVDSTSLLIRYTRAGDANLNGTTEIGDFSLLAANFNNTSTTWQTGDFDYDGDTDIGDFSLLAANFNQSVPSDMPRAVPEPAAAAALSMLAAATARRRRRD